MACLLFIFIMAKRKWQPRETRYLQEYILEHLRPAQTFFRMRLGGMSDEEAKNLPAGVSSRIFVVAQRYADAICIFEDHIEIWEAKLIRPLTAITQLQLYAKLFRKTPEFLRYIDAEVQLHLVTPILDPDLADIAEAAEIAIHYWEPAWVSEYLTSYYRIKPEG